MMIVQKTEKLISVRIELDEGLDYLRLEEYPWIPCSMTITIFDGLEEPVLQFSIFHSSVD